MPAGKLVLARNFILLLSANFRINLKMKPVFKRPKFIGIRLGYRLTGFAPIKETGLLFEIGAGAW